LRPTNDRSSHVRFAHIRKHRYSYDPKARNWLQILRERSQVPLGGREKGKGKEKEIETETEARIISNFV